MNIIESPKFAVICRNYLESLVLELDGLKAAIEKGDFEEIHKVSHKTKGTSGAYKLERISMAATQLQNAVDMQDISKTQVCFDELYNLVTDKLQSL